MIIRRADANDIQEVYKLLSAMHDGTETYTSPMSEGKVLHMIKHMIDKGIVLVAEEKGKIIGSQAGNLASDWWSEEKFLSDVWFFVHPNSRKSRAAIKLVKCFIKIGKELKVKVKLGHVYSGDMDRKDNFFNRLGFVKAGSLFTEVS
tara:strand:- start:348 stop:788 length:441 start_codon:yes stop_codon:yes gene_type:complete